VHHRMVNQHHRSPDPTADDTVVLPRTDDTVVLPRMDDTVVIPRVVHQAIPESAAPESQSAAVLDRSDTRLGNALKWSYVFTTGGYAITAILTFILAAILSPREFGVLTMALVWVALALVLLQHGPTIAVIQQDDITEDHANAAFWSTLAGAVGFCLLFAAFAPLWAALNGLPELTPVCLALTPMVIITALNVIPDALQRRRMQMRGIAIRVLVANLTGGIAGVTCAFAGLGVWSLVVQQVGTPAVYGAMLWMMTDWRPRFRGPIRQQLRDIRRTSLHTYAGAVGVFLSSRTDVVLMGLFFGPVVIGLYRFAARFAEMVVDLTARGLHQVSLPHLARHGSDKVGFTRELGRLMHGVAVLAYPMLGIVAGVAEPLVLFIGDQWAEAAGPLRVLCVVSGMVVLAALFEPALQAAQRPGITAVFAWITTVTSGLAIFAASRASASGTTSDQLMAAAWAMLTVQGVLVVVTGYVIFRRVLRVSVGPILVAGIPGTLSAAVAAFASSATYGMVDATLDKFFALAVSGIAGVAVAGVVLLVLDREVRTRVFRMAGRLRRRTAATSV
jgi:O-antigen/teichoic acid export membrane protein